MTSCTRYIEVHRVRSLWILELDLIDSVGIFRVIRKKISKAINYYFVTTGFLENIQTTFVTENFSGKYSILSNFLIYLGSLNFEGNKGIEEYVVTFLKTKFCCSCMVFWEK